MFYQGILSFFYDARVFVELLGVTTEGAMAVGCGGITTAGGGEVTTTGFGLVFITALGCCFSGVFVGIGVVGFVSVTVSVAIDDVSCKGARPDPAGLF